MTRPKERFGKPMTQRSLRASPGRRSLLLVPALLALLLSALPAPLGAETDADREDPGALLADAGDGGPGGDAAAEDAGLPDAPAQAPDVAALLETADRISDFVG